MKRVKNNIGVRLGLYRSNINSKGEHPLVIFLRAKSRTKKISTGFHLKEEQWDCGQNAIKSGVHDALEIEQFCAHELNEIRAIISKFNYLNKRLSLEELVAQYRKIRIESRIYLYFEVVIQRLAENGSIKNSKVYRTASNVMKSFRSDPDLTFNEVDARFLEDLSFHLRSRGVRDGALSNYFRTIRALFNKAINDDEIDASVYPFKKFSVAQFKTESIPKTISKMGVHQVIDYYKENPVGPLSMAAEVFTFIYLTGGINFRDLAKLKFKNVVDQKISYFRSKTGKAYTLTLQPVAISIIEKYRDSSTTPDDYIFPYLRRDLHITETQIYDRSKKCLGLVNKDLKMISYVLEIPVPLTTYVARHSLASNLCAAGVSVKTIQNLLGHSRLETTNGYLRNFTATEVNDQIAHLL